MAFPGTTSYNAIAGLMTVKGEFRLSALLLCYDACFLKNKELACYFSFPPDTTFAGFRNVCSSETNFMFMTNPSNEDLQHPVHVSGITVVDSTEGAKVFIHRPDVR